MAGGEREVMGFETLTLAPIDRRLVVPELLSAQELAWLDAYHARVRDIIGPELGPADRAWLEAATAEIRRAQRERYCADYTIRTWRPYERRNTADA